MKRCPTCNRTYSDNTLSFCLEDGLLLSAEYDPGETLVLPTERIAEKDLGFSVGESVATYVSPSIRGTQEPVETNTVKVSKRVVYVIAGLIVLSAIIGSLLWFNLAKKKTTTQGSGFANSSGMEFVEIPAGEFMMGSTNGKASEQPIHQVRIGQPFYMGKYEVTQTQWQSIMGTNPSNFSSCDNCPVEQVSWDDAQRFLAKLNDRNDEFHYRLPSEAEWEYACRAGTTGDYAGDLDSMGWYGNNSGNSRLDADRIFREDQSNYFKRLQNNGNRTHPVGTKQPNAFGLYDMHGNVQEWCQDWGHDNYAGAPTDGSAWLSREGKKSRVSRGGSWYLIASTLRSASRNWTVPLPGFDDIDQRDIDIGFRVVAEKKN